MKLRRDVAVTPRQTGAEAWAEIVGLIARDDSLDRKQLEAAATVMATLLTEEHYAEKPLTLKGNGPRVVIYCVYGADALTVPTPDALHQNPTAGDWALYVPCLDEDLAWAGGSLSVRAPRIRLHGLDEAPALRDEPAGKAIAEVTIDWGALR